jgi:predicted GIY-YIG superfamily endonuclease
MKCRVCQSSTINDGLLFKCQNKVCKAVHWDKSAIKRIKLELRDPAFLESTLAAAKVPDDKPGEFYVYILRLRMKGAKDPCYVGRTGHHPYKRYLNHLRGHKSSKITKKYATALIHYEGPMGYDESVEREKTLWEEKKMQGINAHGGK